MFAALLIESLPVNVLLCWAIDTHTRRLQVVRAFAFLNDAYFADIMRHIAQL